MQGEPIPVAGKTGTAQLGAGDPHSWFAGFAPYGAAATHSHCLRGGGGTRRLRRARGRADRPGAGGRRA